MREEKSPIRDNEMDNQEIDLLELAQKLWVERRLIFKWCAIGAVAALIIAFSIPKEYTTTIKLAPEVNDAKGGAGSLGSLASLAGINTSGGGSDAVYPDLYPDIMASVPFATGLFEVPVTDSTGELHTTVRDYIDNETTSPWWSFILSLPGKALGGVMSLFRDDEEQTDGTLDTFHLTKDEYNTMQALSERINADVDSKTSVISLSVTMQDPLVSALLADTVAERLKNYVTEYRTNKAREDMGYIAALNAEAKTDYYAAQQRYADYIDKNHGIVLRSGRTEEERLQNEAALAFNLYNSTAQQLQHAKAKVQEITPVYTVVQPATVPLRPSKPSKMLILVGLTFLSAVAASAWILFGRDLVASFKSKKASK